MSAASPGGRRTWARWTSCWNRRAAGRWSRSPGMAGIGKTTLAVHWAHRVRDQFPDGQLFVNLSGHGPGEPRHAAGVLGQLLHGLGVPSERIPTHGQTAAGLYRTMLAGRRILVVLDNAADTEQVLPLLPGTPGCFTLVTSRDQLGGLITAVGARVVTLDVVTDTEAREIAGPPDRGRAGARRTRRGRPDPAAVRPAAPGAGHRGRPRRPPARPSHSPRSPMSSATRGTGSTRLTAARRGPISGPSFRGRTSGWSRPRPGCSGCSGCTRPGRRRARGGQPDRRRGGPDPARPGRSRPGPPGGRGRAGPVPAARPVAGLRCRARRAARPRRGAAGGDAATAGSLSVLGVAHGATTPTRRGRGWPSRRDRRGRWWRRSTA